MAKYLVSINERIRNVRVYVVKKRISGNANAISRFVESLIQKYVLKEKREA